MERIFTSVKSRVTALIAAVNNSNPLVGNSLWEEPECENTHTHTHSVYCYPYSYKLCILPLMHIFMNIHTIVKKVVI